jgi:hypothetical protein
MSGPRGPENERERGGRGGYVDRMAGGRGAGGMPLPPGVARVRRFLSFGVALRPLG